MPDRTFDKLTAMFPQTEGPGDMSEFLALEFQVKYAKRSRKGGL